MGELERQVKTLFASSEQTEAQKVELMHSWLANAAPAENVAPKPKQPKGEVLKNLPYRELQERAKAAGIPAEQTTGELIAALESHRYTRGY